VGKSERVAKSPPAVVGTHEGLAGWKPDEKTRPGGTAGGELVGPENESTTWKKWSQTAR